MREGKQKLRHERGRYRGDRERYSRGNDRDWRDERDRRGNDDRGRYGGTSSVRRRNEWEGTPLRRGTEDEWEATPSRAGTGTGSSRRGTDAPWGDWSAAPTPVRAGSKAGGAFFR